MKITTTAKNIIREQKVRELWCGGGSVYIGTMIGPIVVAKKNFSALLPESCFDK